jgi:hypothetical protein
MFVAFFSARIVYRLNHPAHDSLDDGRIVLEPAVLIPNAERSTEERKSITVALGVDRREPPK